MKALREPPPISTGHIIGADFGAASDNGFLAEGAERSAGDAVDDFF